MEEDKIFPKAFSEILQESPGVSPNSWAPLQYDKDSFGNITKYRLLSVIEGAECSFDHDDKTIGIYFKKCSLLTLDILDNHEFRLSYFPQDAIDSPDNDRNFKDHKITEFF